MAKFRLMMVGAVLALLAVQTAEACTSIRLKTQDGLVFYARTMEFGGTLPSKVAVVPKGTAYQGTLPDNTPKGLRWTAKYGFVGMNAFGLPLMSDGMNEAGLIVGNLLFPGYAEYEPFEPGKAGVTLSHYEVGTWLLSSFATVAEVRQAIGTVRVCQGSQDEIGALPLHITVHDAKGDSLVIEFVKGKVYVYDNPLGVLTNSPPFPWHTTYLSNFVNLSAVNVPEVDLGGLEIKQFGQGSGMVGLPGDFTPPSRFVRMVALTQSALPVKGPEAGLTQAMTIIDNVDIPKGTIRDKSGKESIRDFTQWVVVADVSRQRYYFRTYDNKNWRFVDLGKALKGAKGIQTLSLDIPPDYPAVTPKAK